MPFCELYKIMVNKITFIGFRGLDSQPKNFRWAKRLGRGQKSLTLGEQQYFVWGTTSQSTK